MRDSSEIGPDSRTQDQERDRSRLETMGRTMTDFGLPEPADDSTEVARERLRWDRRSCQQYLDAHLPLLTPDEQRPIYEEVIEAVRLRRPLLMYVDGRSGRGKTLLMKVITAAVRAQGDISLAGHTHFLRNIPKEVGVACETRETSSCALRQPVWPH